MRKQCRVCHVVTDLDETGRCAFCALCYEAVEAGTSYGKYVAQRDHVRTEPHEPREEPWPEAITGNATCPVCGQPFSALLFMFCSFIVAHRQFSGQ